MPEYPFPYFNQNEFGGSFGGPVPKIKNTYFFAAYEKLFRNSPVFLRNTRLPHPSLLAGDFTMIADAAKPAVPAGITLTSAEIAQNTVNGQGLVFTKIPQRLMNPVVGTFVQKYFPAVSTGAPINASNGRLWSSRRTSLGRCAATSVRYAWTTIYRLGPDLCGLQRAGGHVRHQPGGVSLYPSRIDAE